MSITTIIGPMFSGKTTELIRLIRREKLIKKNKCLVIKHVNDIRYDEKNTNMFNHITTHDGESYDECDFINLSNFTDDKIVDDIINKYNVVGIDEGFFFKDINFFCNKLADAGVSVIVSSIDSSYQQEIFSEVADLIAMSERIIKLSAICMICEERDASFTIRISDSKEKFLVGGKDLYRCVCRQCLNIFKKNRQIVE